MPIWLSLAIAIGILGILVAAVSIRRATARTEIVLEGINEGLPEAAATSMTPLQKRAWCGLGIGAAVSLAILANFVDKGVTKYDEDPAMRGLVSALFVGGLVANAVLLLPLRRPGQVDERDHEIMSRAWAVQSLAVILSLAAWAIALTEFSTLMVNTLALCAGILLGATGG